MTDNKLIIIRGLPGSGKSFFANQLLQKGDVQQVLDVEEFMTDSQGNYNFNVQSLKKAHEMCLMWTKYYLDKGFDVAVSNVFSRRWEIQQYTRLGYSFDVIEMKGNYKNIHNVPKGTINNFKKRWEKWV